MKRISIATLAILMLIAGSAFAQRPGPGGPGPAPGPNNSALAEYLALTTAQKAAWETIQNDFRTSAEALHMQERALAEQLETAFDASNANAIGTLLLQIRAIHEQIRVAKEAADAKFAALLTSEQNVKFAAFQAAVEFLRQHGPGPGGPGGPR